MISIMDFSHCENNSNNFVLLFCCSATATRKKITTQLLVLNFKYLSEIGAGNAASPYHSSFVRPYKSSIYIFLIQFLFVGTNSFRLRPKQQAFSLSVFLSHLFIAALMDWQLFYIYDAQIQCKIIFSSVTLWRCWLLCVCVCVGEGCLASNK